MAVHKKIWVNDHLSTTTTIILRSHFKFCFWNDLWTTPNYLQLPLFWQIKLAPKILATQINFILLWGFVLFPLSFEKPSTIILCSVCHLKQCPQQILNVSEKPLSFFIVRVRTSYEYVIVLLDTKEYKKWLIRRTTTFNGSNKVSYQQQVL